MFKKHAKSHDDIFASHAKKQAHPIAQSFFVCYRAGARAIGFNTGSPCHDRTQGKA
jgi:hypothetical protein